MLQLCLFLDLDSSSQFYGILKDEEKMTTLRKRSNIEAEDLPLVE